MSLSVFNRTKYEYERDRCFVHLYVNDGDENKLTVLSKKPGAHKLNYHHWYDWGEPPHWE